MGLGRGSLRWPMHRAVTGLSPQCQDQPVPAPPHAWGSICPLCTEDMGARPGYMGWWGGPSRDCRLVPRGGRNGVQKHQGCPAQLKAREQVLASPPPAGLMATRQGPGAVGLGAPPAPPSPHPQLLCALPITSLSSWEAGGSLQFYPTPCIPDQRGPSYPRPLGFGGLQDVGQVLLCSGGH